MEIKADTKNILGLLSGHKYNIDYYQREYRWQRKHVFKMLEDLYEKFSDNYYDGQRKKHARSIIQNYSSYFLGSIIISKGENEEKFITDGQQRLTSLTLLLIVVFRSLTNESPDSEKQKYKLFNLIRFDTYGDDSFTLDVEERRECLDEIFTSGNFESTAEVSESVENIVNRYRDIEEYISSLVLTNEELLWFSDWLITKVYLVEIEAATDREAYTIFETMNDRGLSLDSADMLKGYLLSNIESGKRRDDANDKWRNIVRSFQDVGKDEHSDAIKAWLRGKYAPGIRERHKNAEDRDYELIGNEFHRWVRAHEELLELESPDQYYNFITKEFAYYSSRYKELRKASNDIVFAHNNNLESVYYNGHNNFTLQYPLLLSSIMPTDSEEVVMRKFRLLSAYLDIIIARRIWNNKSFSYSDRYYNIFQLMLEVRNRPVREIKDTLVARLEKDKDGSGHFALNRNFSLGGRNGPQVHFMLARMANYIDREKDGEYNFAEYIQRGGKMPYGIEHIWSKNHDYTKEFTHEQDFLEYRNRIGGLLILPKSFNSSYGDMTYSKKYDPYYGQRNYLAKSLNQQCYGSEPRFKDFVTRTGLPFQPHTEFKKADLDKRQELYLKLAEQIWNPQNLREL